jgi:hypothetical protein
MKENIKNIRGYVEVLHYDSDMNLIHKYDFENLVVNTGLNWVAQRLNDPTPAVMSHIAVGTDPTLPALNQTALLAEIYRQSMSVLGGAVSGASIVYSCTIGPGNGTGALQEAGLFNADPGGTMLSRVTYPVINKGASDTIAISWTITVG